MWSLRNSAFLAFLGLASGLSSLAGAAEKPVAIDVILPLTGSGSFLGKQEQIALEIIEKLVNREGGIRGRPVQFAYHDDETNPQVALQLFQEIRAGNPPVILGSALLAACNAIAPMLREGPVDYCFSPTIHPPAGSYVFTSGVESYDGQRAVIRYFREKGLTRLALVTSTDATGQDAERGISDTVKLPENSGVTLVERAHYNPSDISVAAQMERIKAASPQVILVWSTGAPFATVLKGLVQAGIDVPVVANYGNMTLAQMRQYADFLPKDLYFPSPMFPLPPAGMAIDPGVAAAQEKFYAAFKAEGLLPDSASDLAWDAALIVVDTLRQLGPDATAPEIRNHIAGLKGFSGINGSYDFTRTPQRGLDVGNVVITRWAAGRRAWEWVSKPGGAPLAP